jgi:AraC-like DNA-binding protein
MWSAGTFRITPEGIPTYELNPSGNQEMVGLGSWEINYDQGYFLSPDGSRANISFVHRHPHFEIFWVRKGCGVLSWDCEQIRVKAGSLLMVAPGEVHAWKLTENLEGSVLSVSETFTSRANFSLAFRRMTALLQPKSNRYLRLAPLDESLIRSFFENLQSGSDESNFDRRELAKAFLLILLGRIWGADSRTKSAGEAAGSPLALRFQAALIAECPRLASVKEFAQLLGVSRSHLHREVIATTGKAPIEWIHERIIVEAKRLLTHTKSPHSEIARLLGFKNASYFGSYFRSHTHQSPAEFRLKRSA